jgi:hypothetical protein
VPRRCVKELAAPTVSLLILLGLRLWLYGEVLPNTYYAKTGGDLMTRLQAGKYYLMLAYPWIVSGIELLPQTWVWLGIAVSCVSAIQLFLTDKVRFVLLPVLGLLIVFFEAGDWMPLARTALPYLCLFFLMPALFIRRPRIGAALLWSVLITTVSCYYLLSPHKDLIAYLGSGNRYSDSLSEFILKNTSSGDSIAMMDIGVVGWRTDRRIIDISGLVEKRIAKSPGGFLGKAYDPEIILKAEPKIIILIPDHSLIDVRLNDYLIGHDSWKEVSLADAGIELPSEKSSIRIWRGR